MISARSPFETHCGKSGHGTNKAERDNGIFHLTEEAGAEEEEEEGGRPPPEGRERKLFCGGGGGGGFAA